jgi:indolepyruvate ferredoxin oxidoreductase
MNTHSPLMHEAAHTLDKGNADIALKIAQLPEHIRGFGHVKQASMDSAAAQRALLLASYRRV